MGKKKWYIHTVKYSLALKKKGNPVTCNNMNEPGRHYDKWNKPDIEGKILIICYHLYEECEIVKFIEAESWMVVVGGEGVGETGSITQRVQNFSLYKMNKF